MSFINFTCIPYGQLRIGNHFANVGVISNIAFFIAGDNSSNGENKFIGRYGFDIVKH